MFTITLLAFLMFRYRTTTSTKNINIRNIRKWYSQPKSIANALHNSSVAPFTQLFQFPHDIPLFSSTKIENLLLTEFIDALPCLEICIIVALFDFWIRSLTVIRYYWFTSHCRKITANVWNLRLLLKLNNDCTWTYFYSEKQQFLFYYPIKLGSDLQPLFTIAKVLNNRVLWKSDIHIRKEAFFRKSGNTVLNNDRTYTYLHSYSLLLFLM